MASPTKPSPQPNPLTDPLESFHYLRVKDLAKRLGMSVNTIWRLSRDPKSNFPKPIRLSEKITVWKLSSVMEYLESKENAA